MRKVVWIDKDGMKRLSTIRDSDPDSMAPYGISHDPPDMGGLEWPVIEEELTGKGLRYDPMEVKMALHEALLVRELSTWRDVMNQQTGMTAAINAAAVKLYSRADHQKAFLTVLKPMLIRLYRSLS